jgi:hypothetical protein
MAKRTLKTRKQSKSAAIRTFMAANPAAGPTAVSQALKKKGILVSPAYVSTVKATSKTKTAKDARFSNGAEAGHGSPTPDRAAYLKQLVITRKYAEQVGGVDSAADLVRALRELVAGN